MADYGLPINHLDYLYQRNVYLTNTTGLYKTSLIIKLVLNFNNFNFDLIKDDGSDFRLTHNDNTLRTWVAYWNPTVKLGVMFFKLQEINAGEDVVLKAYWGNAAATSISEPDKLGFIFNEPFLSTPLNSSIWSGYINEANIDYYGYKIKDTNGPDDNYFTTTINPLLGKKDWVLEAGLYGDWDNSGWGPTACTVGIEFLGSENDFFVRVKDTVNIKHNATVAGGGTITTISQTYGGIEGRSYNGIKIMYKEVLDKIYVYLSDRNTYEDMYVSFNRKVEGDTRPSNIRIRGDETFSYDAGAQPTYINWLAVREYDEGLIEVDVSDLYISYEMILHPPQDFKEYGADITLTVYDHESSFGGNPYLLSEEFYDLETNVWISDVAAVSEAYISVNIYTAWFGDVTNKGLRHYDSGHVYYYNASKLSDDDIDVNNRTFFHGTTTSGWVAIRFDDPTNVASIKIIMHEDLSCAPKDYVFYGSNYNPVNSLGRAQKIGEGTFLQNVLWQSIMFQNYAPYKYYILDIKNTYGAGNIKIQGWEMFPSLGSSKKRYISQLRLHPAMYGDYSSGFPKEISLQGSNDSYTWETIVPWIYTYTPFIQHIPSYGYWQRYSFDNTKGYWSFRLLCRGNWGKSDGRIIIGEWSMHELASEAYTYRILSGTTNNIQQIWASPDCNIENRGALYVANENLNTIKNNTLVEQTVLPEQYDDFNVI